MTMTNKRKVLNRWLATTINERSLSVQLELRPEKDARVRYCSGYTIEAAFARAADWADYFVAIEAA
jgi:hypothetical protein